MHGKARGFYLIMIAALTAAGCAPSQQALQERGHLSVKLLYPTAPINIEMGQTLQTIVQVVDDNGQPARDARVELTIVDAGGNELGVVPAAFGSGDVFRSPAWLIPHRSQAGTWSLTAKASSEAADGSTSGSFSVKDSVSEVLLRKYGFWADAPRLKGIEPGLFKEQGDADNGAVLWGGLIQGGHVLVENWLEVQWRKGNFNLTTPHEVRAFMLGDLGNFGMVSTRELGPFEKVKFKQWDAWLVKARGAFAQYDEQWMIFYAPEADKTYALGTTVALPPEGIDAHAVLRDGFEVHPEVHANGQAPEPLPVLLPEPELISPALDSRFLGAGAEIVLQWKPLKDLAPDEYYQVHVDYNYSETNTAVHYATRQTELRLPAVLYDRPNCEVFNWQVTLMRQTGVDADGQPVGEPISYNSLYWYVRWLRPLGEKAPFNPVCPNPQT